MFFSVTGLAPVASFELPRGSCFTSELQCSSGGDGGYGFSLGISAGAFHVRLREGSSTCVSRFIPTAKSDTLAQQWDNNVLLNAGRDGTI